MAADVAHPLATNHYCGCQVTQISDENSTFSSISQIFKAPNLADS
jgi:hypothetical protein